MSNLDAVSLEELRQDFADCRGELRHAWTRQTGGNLTTPDAGCYWSAFRCSRCKTKRLDLISERTGAVVSRRYEHPEGYKLDEKVTINDLRLLFRQRQSKGMPKRLKRGGR